MTERVLARVRMHAVVEITTDGGPWGSNFTLDDVHQKGSRQALEQLRKILQGKAKIIGNPEVAIVIVSKEK